MNLYIKLHKNNKHLYLGRFKNWSISNEFPTKFGTIRIDLLTKNYKWQKIFANIGLKTHSKIVITLKRWEASFVK